MLPSADDLIKRDVFALPSPFPLLQLFAPVPPSSSRFSRVHTSQFPLSTHQGPTVRESLNPYWPNESACWEVEVQEGAWARVRVHDAGRWKKKGQGFLGEITLADVWTLLPQDGRRSHLAVADPSFAHRPSYALSPPRTSYPQLQPRPAPLAAGRLDLEAAAAASATSVHRGMTLAEHRRGAAVVINVDDALSGGGEALPGHGEGGSSPGGFAADEAAEGLSRLTIAIDPQSPSPSGVHYFGQDGGSRPSTARVGSPLGAEWEDVLRGSSGEEDYMGGSEKGEGRSGQKEREGEGAGHDAAFGTHDIVWRCCNSRAQLQLCPFDFDLDDVPSGSASSRKYLVDHNTKTTTWDDPRLSSLQPESDQGKRDFRRKLVYFRSQPPLRPPSGGGDVRLIVRRSNLFEDAFSEVMKYPKSELKKRLMITFKGEEGVDFGACRESSFSCYRMRSLIRAIACSSSRTKKASYTLQVNPNSGVNSEHLDYFTFVGRCVGLAIFHRRFLDTHFATSIYKSCLEKKVGLDDIALVDRQLWQSLSWMANNDITDILDLDFTSQYETFGALETLDLKPNGADVAVTEENKHEYIELLCEHRLHGRVEKQLEAFKKGLDGIVPLKELKVFDEKELELLIGGVETIDVGDWQKNTAYRGYQQEDELVQWFWQAVKAWPAEMKSRLLQFTTGTSRTPVNGFKDLQGSDGPRLFTLEKSGETTQLPKSHTCFNRLDLPPYPNFEILEQKLAFAVENTMGFGHE
ncbi:hypothetical protein JCM1841_004358 [Sporobolomyces salmonicolor]